MAQCIIGLGQYNTTVHIQLMQLHTNSYSILQYYCIRFIEYNVYKFYVIQYVQSMPGKMAHFPFFFQRNISVK